MTSKSVRLTALLLISAGLVLSGCTPEPEPTPTPTSAFATEDEAFAAAEETYRAYIQAFNAVDLQRPETFEAQEEFTAGDYRADERVSLSTMHAEGYQRGGAIRVVWFKGVAFTEDASVSARTCDDVSATTFTDRDGNSLVPPDRPAVYALDLRFEIVDGELKLVGSDAVEDVECAV